MDREGFRNRLNQYKKAREENPGLKYWEWKAIPKYEEGVGAVTVPKYKVNKRNPELADAAQEAIDWTASWHAARKATGKYDDQYASMGEYAQRPVLIAPKQSVDSAGSFYGTPQQATIRINPDLKPKWGNTTKSAIVHELAHEMSLQNAGERMLVNQVKGSSTVDKVAEITGVPLYNTNEAGSSYEENAAEYYARLSQMREAMKADPNKTYELPELKPWLKLFDLPADERGVRLMNDVASVNHYNDDGIFMAAEGGVVPKYDSGTAKVSAPTEEEYIAQQIEAKKIAALQKSLTRIEPRVPKGVQTGEQWNPITKKVEPIFECGPSCAYTFSDNYNQNWMGSEDFRLNHEKYGWNQIPWENRKPGDAVLIVDDNGVAKHTMMYDSDNTQGQPLFNHSNGGHDSSAIRKKAKYPHHNPYLTYEYVGTPADSTQWKNEYKQLYGYAEGTDGVLNSYYKPESVEGLLAKTAIQLADPTGISSYPDVWYSGKEFFNDPSWRKAGDVGLNVISALPLIGKVTAPFKAAKMAKMLDRVGDATALMKGVEKAERVNKIIDTVPELIPVVRQVAEKTQDVTTKLFSDPMFNWWASVNKVDRVNDFRKANTAIDVLNISNNATDLGQGGAELAHKITGYADGGEVTGPPTEEQWYADITKYNPTILDNASMYWSIEQAKKDLHAQAMGLPGYATMWNEYMRTLPKDDPDIDEFVDELWTNENPNNTGYNKVKKRYFPHKSPEGGKTTIGPGFKIGSGSHNISEREAKNGVTKARLNQEARRVGKQHLNAVDQFLNYGQTTNPADTVSPQIKMGLMDLRHQVGPLNEWGNLRQAVLEGDLDRIKKESTVTWKDNGVTKVDKRRKKLRDEKYWHY